VVYTYGVNAAVAPLKAASNKNKPVLYGGKLYTDLTDSDKLAMMRGLR